MANPLNHKQKRFALEYRVDGNATQAALRAGYSPATAHSQGHRLLKNAKIRALLDAKLEQALAKVEARGDSVLGELAHIGFVDPIGLFCVDGTLKHLEEMEPQLRRAIKSLKFTELFDGASGEKFVAGRVVDIQFWDKTKSLELLGKNQKLFTDKVEHSVDASLADLLAMAMKPEGE